MKVFTPAISWHNRERVASIDFQPSPWPESGYRRRLASGGDDHHVVIWEVSPNEGEKPELSCICDLSRHQNSVNIVRWSKDGKLLASGDTDNVIFLWHFQDNDAPPDLFGEDNANPNDEGDGFVASENWSVYKTLRGHLQDILGLDFSPCGGYLVSCSTDNSAIVFDVKKATKLKILSEHKGWVNGVAWDPLNKHVVSIASDRIMRCYKSKNYKLAMKTSKCKLAVGTDPETGKVHDERTVRLFHDDTFQSFYRRLAFSPDGEILAVPSGVLDIDGEAKTENCTYLFSRLDLTRPVLYLPHKEYSVAVRFSPIKYKLRKANPAKEKETKENLKPWDQTSTLFQLPYRMVYAVATQDAVALYDTQQAEPFARVSKIHYVGLTDLTWSDDGTMLVASSSDGYCSIIEVGDIGEPFDCEALNSPSKNETSGNSGKKSDEDCQAMEVDEEKTKKTPEKEATLIAVRR